MALDLRRDCSFSGPALPEPFVKFELEKQLKKHKLLHKRTGGEGKQLQASWDVYRRKLRALGEHGGERRVANHVLDPLVERLGYSSLAREKTIITREGAEDGGWLLEDADGNKLRAWTVALGTDLDAPSRRGRAYRFSPGRAAQRVLLAQGERIGLLTDGEELRLLICDPARPESHISIRLDRAGGWRAATSVPDSYRLLLALASPDGVKAVPGLTEAARLAQSAVTDKLRLQARRAIERFVQGILDDPENAEIRSSWEDLDEIAKSLWREGLITVYRLLFIFKLESSDDPAQAFSFASTSLWRNTYSPNTALAPLVREALDRGVNTGGMLELGLRTLWRLFANGMSSSELEIKALGGMLFRAETTPLLDGLIWGEQSVAELLDHLLWTPGDSRDERERVHYGALDVEDLGRVYEALLELEPGITTEPMCRLRRAKLEVVVPIHQGTPYRGGNTSTSNNTKVQFIEEIPAGHFFLRVGLGRKASGSYYTPHPFVRFLVQETLGPQLEERSPKQDPQPGHILDFKVLDPAMGSGHFLVEACRYLGEALYEACRLCDELAVEAEEQAEKTEGSQREVLLARAVGLRKRVEDLPDPENELLAYLPSRAAEGEESGLSQRMAEAMCRRLVAVHCVYGVDKNPLAVELAKLTLWLESYSEGLPLTFMDHRLVCGDSLTGPFFEHVLSYPSSGEKLDDLFAQGLIERLRTIVATTLAYVLDLEASVGTDFADLERKRVAKKKFDEALAPLETLSAAWSGGVMLGDECDDAGYLALAQAVAKGNDCGEVLAKWPRLQKMVTVGNDAIAFHLTFPEVFQDVQSGGSGFDAVIGNPPWEGIDTSNKEFFAGFDISILDVRTSDEEAEITSKLLAQPDIAQQRRAYDFAVAAYKNTARKYFSEVNQGAERASGATPDLYQCFIERSYQVLSNGGWMGVVVPSAFHANEGAAGLRRLMLERMEMQFCFSFENRKKLFEIDSRQKFAILAARKEPSGTHRFQCAFYLQDLEWLFDFNSRSELLEYTPRFISQTTPGLGNFLELRSGDVVPVAEQMYSRRDEWFGEFRRRLGVSLTEELHKSKNKWRLELTSDVVDSDSDDPRVLAIGNRLRQRGYLPLHEGKTFNQYTDMWDLRPEFCVSLERMNGKEARVSACRFFRLAFRTVASSTNERTSIFTILPPGVLLSHSAHPESAPESRSTASALMVAALCNTHAFDWLLRQQVAANVTFNFLDAVPIPKLNQVRRFLAHLALRLTCNHAGYSPLWIEQLGDKWREQKPLHTWPVLDGNGHRWAVWGAIDAVVADAYGLDRSKYGEVLSSFSHKSYPNAPEACLTAFDELKVIGLDSFTMKYDPYSDIPFCDDLPEPVIDLRVPSDQESVQPEIGLL
jgi:hypothetical protein